MEEVTENQPICRVCLKIVEITTQSFGYIEDATGNLRDMLFCCVPEMDIYVSINPIICIQCIHALINIYQFKSRCINTETIIRTYIKKHNLSEEDPVKLGAVVKDLIKLNTFFKQQEEKKIQIAMEQQKNNAHQFAPSSHFFESQNHTKMQLTPEQQNKIFANRAAPPLHFLERPQNPTNMPMPVREYPLHLQHPSFMGLRPSMGFVSHNFGPPHHIRHLGPIPPMSPPPRPPIGSSLQLPMGSQLQPPLGSSLQAPMGSSLQAPMGSSLQPTMGSLLQPPIGSSLQPPMGSSLQPPMGSSLQPPMGSSLQPPMGSSLQPPMGSSPQLPMGSLLQPPMGSSLQLPMGSPLQPPMAPIRPQMGLPPPLIMMMPSMDSLSQKNSNGYVLPVHPGNMAAKQNILHSLTFPIEPTVSSLNTISDVSAESSITNIVQKDKTKLVQHSSNEVDNKCIKNTSENKINYHPIESKLRLVIKIPRHKSIIPLNETKTSDIEDYPMDSSNNEKEDAPMDDAEEHLEDMQADITDDIPEDYPEYLPEDGTIDISKIYNTDNDASLETKNITKIYNCSCMYLTTSETLFSEHKKRCKNSGKKNMVKCPHCPHVTNRAYALNKHINTMHTRAFWFHCESCSYRSTDKSCLRRHVRKNHEERSNSEINKQFCCNICSMVINTEHNFNRHMIKHEESYPTNYECDFCSYNSKDRSNFRKHIFTHSPIQLQCPNCPYSNVSPYQLRTHIKRFHDGAGMEAADCKSEVPISEIISDIKDILNCVEGDQGNECS